MVQRTFADMEYANRKRTTRREAFLDAMESERMDGTHRAVLCPERARQETKSRSV